MGKGKLMNLKKICLLIISMVLPSLLVGYAILGRQSVKRENTNPVISSDLSGFHLLYISDNSTMPAIVDELQSLGVNQTTYSNLQESSNITAELAAINGCNLVIFDTDWISSQINNTNVWQAYFGNGNQTARGLNPAETFDNNQTAVQIFYGLLTSVYGGTKLVAIGPSTSSFFQALDLSGVYRLPQDAAGNETNPAYYNPPMVGYMYSRTSTPDGTPLFYPSIFSCGTSDPKEMAKSLADWLAGG